MPDLARNAEESRVSFTDGSARIPWSDWLPEIVLLVVTTGAGIWAAGRWMDPLGDPGYACSLAYRLIHGERLYRDIYIQHTPLSPYLLAAGGRLFGLSVRYFLYANWVPAVLASVLLLRCGRFFLSTLECVALAGVILATSVFLPGPGHLILPYYPGVVHALTFSLVALLFIQRDSPPSACAVAAGFFAGLAFGCKQEIGIAALLAAATPLVTGVPRPWRRAAWLSAGFALVLLPTAAFVLSSASVESLRRDSHLWPLAFWPSAANRHFYPRIAGLTNSRWQTDIGTTVLIDLSFIGLLALGSLLLARERSRRAWFPVLSLLAAVGVAWVLAAVGVGWQFANPWNLRSYSLSLSMVVAFLVAILAWVSPKLPERRFLVAMGTFAGLAGARAAFSVNEVGHYQGPAHFASALTSVVFVLVFVPRLLLGSTRSAAYLRIATMLGVLALSWWQALAGIQYQRFPKRVAVETPEGRVFTEPGQAALLQAVARHAAAGERVLAIPESYGIDALFHLRPVSPWVGVLPGWLDADMERRLIRRFETSPPDVVILLERSFPEYGYKAFGKGYGFTLADWISDHYATVESLPAGKVLRPRETP
ncbi:MAG TPA: hypothetical protein VF376_07595 [Thermoanaerobaculia bacterium]